MGHVTAYSLGGGAGLAIFRLGDQGPIMSKVFDRDRNFGFGAYERIHSFHFQAKSGFLLGGGLNGLQGCETGDVVRSWVYLGDPKRTRAPPPTRTNSRRTSSGRNRMGPKGTLGLKISGIGCPLFRYSSFKLVDKPLMRRLCAHSGGLFGNRIQ